MMSAQWTTQSLLYYSEIVQDQIYPAAHDEPLMNHPILIVW